ncbi:MAG TPA: FimB/Mfa2 family fimbrial subunit [Candidatus Rikenella faecigallinarum]|uniref:FimB/Mfa2 family fimbrial subunit n=1 Tax=Candidatus Rikenella faecigallinarum TaxID=2838745 RepID=A0A9D1QDJ5_9BACT|nr:FimB/Mfa2 family fimbrial subunit [Candidatus Rikenella faecigallinarum]
MKNQSKYGCASAWWRMMLVLALVLTLGGCKKRPYTRIAQIPLQVKLDWSALSEADVIPETLKLLLFREDGTLQAQYEISKDGQMLGLLDVGTYKAICVNLTDRVQLLNANTYESTQIVAKELSLSTGTLSTSIDDITSSLIYQPGWIYSSSMPEIKVGDPAITDDKNTLSTIVMPMHRTVKVVNFNFTVTGLTNEIQSVWGALDNVAAAVNLPESKILGEYQAASPFRLTPQEDGTLAGTMLIFGNAAETNEQLRNNLLLQFETSSGRTITQEEDITDLMQEAEGDDVVDIYVEANLEVQLNAGLITIIIDWKPGSGEDVDGH